MYQFLSYVYSLFLFMTVSFTHTHLGTNLYYQIFHQDGAGFHQALHSPSCRESSAR